MKTLRSRYARRVLVPVMAVTVLSACHHWVAQEMTPAQVVTEKEPGRARLTIWKVQETTPSQVVTDKQPDRVRLTMLNGERTELSDPTVSDGDVVGLPLDDLNRVVMYDTLRVPADSVASIEIREPDQLATLIGVIGLVVAGVVALSVAWSNQEWQIFPE